MERVREIVLFIHLVGFGALFGGAFVQLGDAVKVINAAMLQGILTAVASGIVLVGVIEGLDESVDRPQIAVKFAVALVVALLCWTNRARERVPTGLFNAIVLLTLIDVGIAVFW